MKTLYKPEAYYVCETKDGKTLDFSKLCNRILVRDPYNLVYFYNILPEANEKNFTLGVVSLDNVSCIRRELPDGLSYYMSEMDTKTDKPLTDFIGKLSELVDRDRTGCVEEPLDQAH